jgi:hypothetical protein
MPRASSSVLLLSAPVLAAAAVDEELTKGAAAERARLEREAAKLKTPELKAERLEQAAAVQPVVVQVVAPVTKVADEVKRELWRAECVDMAALIRAAADGSGDGSGGGSQRALAPQTGAWSTRP